MNSIQGIRADKGFTQAEVARKLGVDASTVAKWETAGAFPRAQLLPKLAQLLGCTIDDLFREEQRNTG